MVLAVAAASVPAAARDDSAELVVGGTTRSFSVHLPDGRAPRTGFPLILAFHGGGGQGAGMSRLTGLNTLADARGLIVAYPDGIDRHWNDGRLTIRNPQDDVLFVSALLDRLQDGYPVDRGRVYATGLSNGALFVERLGCELSGRIAGIAAVAGTLPVVTARKCRPDHPVAVIQINGTDDPIMPFGGGQVATLGGVGEGGRVTSVGQTVALWAGWNGCGDAGPVEALPAAGPPDGTQVLRTRYRGCPANGAVTVLTVAGGGHAWPGGPQYARPAVIGRASRQLDATQLIVDSLLSLPPR
ncbi:alpha/beta hydrolase family esterase [Roseomonas elaeocarpi]|uniref:Alpha/beta hydrolase family esterase n=1 Tax=Roseomonas elaeocarpi TaxID=907779 RepID=A0ABV6JQT1_9PROT